MSERRRSGLDGGDADRAVLARQPAPLDLGERRAAQLRQRLAARRLALLDLGDACLHDLRFLAALNLELDRLAGRHDAEACAQLGRAAHGMAVQRRYDIALPESGRRRRRIRLDLGDLRPFVDADRRLHRDAQAPALHFAELDQLVHHRARQDRGHGETNADVAARRPDDRRVDADQLAFQVD